ncbi:MAG: hypothetical protein ACRCTJ_06500 [Brevinema sp.]
MFTRKKIWEHFYALIISDILMGQQIKSATLKNICDQLYDKRLYSSTLEDLSFFFKVAEPDKVLSFASLIITETYDKKTAEQFIEQYKSTILISA